MKRIVLLLACLVVMPVQAGELFRWVDKAGKVNYGDTPPADAVKVRSIKSSSGSSPDDDLPYETRIAQQNFPVTLYAASKCGELCDQARGLLDKRGIPFTEKELNTRQDTEAFRKLFGMEASIPMLQVGKDFLKGFIESQWNSELDIAGYAKTASYRQRLLQQQQPTTKTAPAGEGQTNSSEPAAQ